MAALRSTHCGSKMSEGQHQDSLRLFQKVPLTDKDDSYNSQLHLLVTREYFCSLSHEPPDTLGGMEDLHHHTHSAGESVNSGPTGVINIRVRTQTHVCNLSSKLFPRCHTLPTRACGHTHTRRMHRGAHTSPCSQKCTQVPGPEDWVCNTFFIADLPINPCL